MALKVLNLGIYASQIGKIAWKYSICYFKIDSYPKYAFCYVYYHKISKTNINGVLTIQTLFISGPISKCMLNIKGCNIKRLLGLG